MVPVTHTMDEDCRTRTAFVSTTMRSFLVAILSFICSSHNTQHVRPRRRSLERGLRWYLVQRGVV